jgi:hypothetical protein
VYKEVKVAAGTQQTIDATIWNAAVDMALRYVSAYRETLFTDSQIIAAVTADARSSVFSAADSAEIAACGFRYLERNHRPLNP